MTREVPFKKPPRWGYRDTVEVIPDLAYVDPPERPAVEPTIDWAIVSSTAKARPNRWLRVRVPGHAWSHSGAYVQLAPFRPRGSFEAVIRYGDLYVRFTGLDV